MGGVRGPKLKMRNISTVQAPMPRTESRRSIKLGVGEFFFFFGLFAGGDYAFDGFLG